MVISSCHKSPCLNLDAVTVPEALTDRADPALPDVAYSPGFPGARGGLFKSFVETSRAPDVAYSPGFPGRGTGSLPHLEEETKSETFASNSTR